jgi:hypothetical protein
MRPNNSNREERFLHGRGSASVALGVAVLLLLMDLVPLHRTVNSEPSWIKEIVIPLFIVAMGAVIWRIRNLWESLFLGIFVADISLKGLLPSPLLSVFRSSVSPFLWCAAAAIAGGLLISSLKDSGPPKTSA